MKFPLVLALWFPLLQALGAATPVPASDQEPQLIQLLQSTNSLAAKDAACATLKQIGTERCIPVLAELLLDDQLSHSARYALEPMPFPEAGQALVAALAKTTGPIQVGIINSLAMRKEKQAVPVLEKLLATNDPEVYRAAVRALGRIGGRSAALALKNAPHLATTHIALADAQLTCANSMVVSGDRDRALTMFRNLYAEGEAEQIRIAAFRGMVCASGSSEAVQLVTSALAGNEPCRREAALQLAREVGGPGATKAIADILPKLSPQLQVGVIGALWQRGDTSAAKVVAALASSSTADVRIAALKALGSLGNASQVALLAKAAATSLGDEQKAARESLVQVANGKPAKEMLKALGNAPPEVAAELARALGNRRDASAIPQLLVLARTGSESSSAAASQALAMLIDERHLPAMVQLVTESRSEAARRRAVEALNASFQNLLAKNGRVPVDALASNLRSGSLEARAALYGVCSGLVDAQVRAALRAGVADPSPALHSAAVRALCDSRDPELLPDLVRLATDAPEENVRLLSSSAVVRLTRDEAGKLTTPERIHALRTILAKATRPEQKRLVLSGLSDIPDADSFKLAQDLINDVPVQKEAIRAAMKIAAVLPGAQATAIVPSLQSMASDSSDPQIRQEVEAIVKKIEARADYITEWQVTGPYTQAGKGYAELFDVPFPPESTSSQDTKWKDLSCVLDPDHPGVIDLLKALGGQQCVAYARVWLHSDQQQPARLELGSDDGIKVWINDKLVHANNTARPLQVGSDKVDVTLEPGWNSLLLKITQNAMGWEFCARFLRPDGSRVAGLKTAAVHP